jgi:hypothetical protein
MRAFFFKEKWRDGQEVTTTSYRNGKVAFSYILTIAMETT